MLWSQVRILPPQLIFKYGRAILAVWNKPKKSANVNIAAGKQSTVNHIALTASPREKIDAIQIESPNALSLRKTLGHRQEMG